MIENKAREDAGTLQTGRNYTVCSAGPAMSRLEDLTKSASELIPPAIKLPKFEGH